MAFDAWVKIKGFKIKWIGVLRFMVWYLLLHNKSGAPCLLQTMKHSTLTWMKGGENDSLCKISTSELAKKQNNY
jgi:hypothetical protein